jgi:hypothetical protein
LNDANAGHNAAFFKSLVFIPEVFDAISWDEPASICQANQSHEITILAGYDSPYCGGVRHGRFDGCDLLRNCACIHG